MRIDGVNPQADAPSEDFVSVHLTALATGHHFAHHRWFAGENGGEAVDDGLVVAASATKPVVRSTSVSADERLSEPWITSPFPWPGTRQSLISGGRI